MAWLSLFCVGFVCLKLVTLSWWFLVWRMQLPRMWASDQCSRKGGRVIRARLYIKQAVKVRSLATLVSLLVAYRVLVWLTDPWPSLLGFPPAFRRGCTHSLILRESVTSVLLEVFPSQNFDCFHGSCLRNWGQVPAVNCRSRSIKCYLHW